MSNLRSSLVVLLAPSVVAIGLVIGGCGGGDDDLSGTGTARVVLTDAPMSDVDEVHVKITRIELMGEAGAQVLLNDHDIPDDVEMIALGANPLLLGQRAIPAGEYTQVRMLIDDTPGANYVVDSEGERHDLTIPSGAQSGVKLVTGAFEVVDGQIITILLDFNAAASVHQAGQSGQWIMRPTVFANVVTGADLDLGTIRGTVLDEAGAPIVAPDGQVLGVFVETPFGTVGVAEVDPVDGSFELPAVIAGPYNLRVRYADRLTWQPIGDPLDLVVNSTIEQLIAITLADEETLDLAIVVDITP